MNRAVWRARLFQQDGDYRLFRSLVAATLDRVPIRLFSYCIMPNHFHLVCCSGADGQISDFMRLLTLVHSKKWHAARGTTGIGSVYQGRFKAFPVQSDNHFLTVCRYVERNALRAGLVRRAEDWAWGSLADRGRNSNDLRLSEWPVLQPPDWLTLVNGSEPELDAIRAAVVRSRPFGLPDWANAAGAAGWTPGIDSGNRFPDS
jgi:putative transposase